MTTIILGYFDSLERGRQSLIRRGNTTPVAPRKRRAEMILDPWNSSDHSLLAERPHLVGAEAGEAGQYRLGMLAHERRSSRRERRVGQAYRTADHREPSARRGIDVIE